MPRLEHENLTFEEETVLPNPRCLILIYVSSMVVLGWCSCVYKPFLGDFGATPDPPHTKDTFQVCQERFFSEEDQGDTPLLMWPYIYIQ